MGRECLRAAGIAASAVLLLVACATPRSPVGERLDEATGTTVTMLRRPIELVVAAEQARGGEPFAYLAPFEINRMGTRATYLWVSVPAGATVGTPRVLADGQALEMSTEALDLAAIGVSQPPYDSPVPWNAQLCFALAPGAIARLAGARELVLVVSGGAAMTGRYVASDTALGPELAEFAARTASH